MSEIAAVKTAAQCVEVLRTKRVESALADLHVLSREFIPGGDGPGENFVPRNLSPAAPGSTRGERHALR